MAKVQITHRYTDAVLFEHEVSDEQQASGLAMRAVMEAACKSNANLFNANLRGANLRGAKLSNANLFNANLRGAKLVGDRPVIVIGPIGSRSDCLQSYITDAGVMVRAGCFFGTLDAFRAACVETHGDSVHGREYAAATTLIEAHAALWAPAEQTAAEAA